MSLFSHQQWWASAGAAAAECSTDAFAVANLDNARDGGSKVAAGTLSGILRIWRPTRGSDAMQEPVLEQEVGGPILALAAGRFSRWVMPLVALTACHLNHLTDTVLPSPAAQLL